MRSVHRFAWLAVLVAVIGCNPFALFPALDPGITDTLERWNRISIDASGLDHTPPATGENRVWKEQAGPTKASRAVAIVHIAMFDAANAVVGGYESYTRLDPAPTDTSAPAAIAQAAHDTLSALFTAQTATFDAALAEDLAAVPDTLARDNGIEVGKKAAAAILAMRSGDGSDIVNPYVFKQEPGKWRADPINPNQQPLGQDWGGVKPFVLNSASQFRAPPPPAMDSAEYTEAYNEVKRLGGDGITTPTERTEDQTVAGIYWAYDGTPSLCAPPRLYNQITIQLAREHGITGIKLARLLALTNVAMADAGISIWDSKFYYDVWRPVCGIRESDAGTGPSGLGDGNPETVGDPAFVPMCAPASNLTGPNFTPPFPAYPSGHAGFGGALFEVLRAELGTDNISFTFVSDEWNGTTQDHEGNVRPLKPRSFQTLSQAEDENGQSRIYLGIHWAFDKTEGIAMGRKVARHVLANSFQPLH